MSKHISSRKVIQPSSNPFDFMTQEQRVLVTTLLSNVNIDYSRKSKYSTAARDLINLAIAQDPFRSTDIFRFNAVTVNPKLTVFDARGSIVATDLEFASVIVNV